MSDRPFPPLEPGYAFTSLEQQVLAKWQRERTFQATLERPARRGEWVFYEGPPTANNVPHVGHVVTRVVKDLFPRFRTMQGYRVARKAGWDTHGLPVEIEVEKRLGFSGKQQIEEFGIAAFNRECLASVGTYEEKWRAMTERVGYWTDLDHPYVTYSNEYVESVWWALAELWSKGLLTQDYKIQPYCARCGTTLSSHEVAQNYKETDDPSIWVAFPLLGAQSARTTDGADYEFDRHTTVRLVAWTTTPWTVLVNTALALHPEMIYRLVEDPSEEGSALLFGEGLDKAVPLELREDDSARLLDLREIDASRTLARFTGRALAEATLRYQRPFRVDSWNHRMGPPTGDPADPGPRYDDDLGWPVVAADYVTAAEGTGVVHTAPAYGEDDYRTGQEHGLPVSFSVGAEGKVVTGEPDLEAFAGTWFKEADRPIIRELRSRGYLLHAARHRHSYPFCWRCDSPLLYYATMSWFVRTSSQKNALVARNQQIHWYPEHVGEGRFGNWLENVVDWAVSRSRYWGTPLPVWRCECPPRVDPPRPALPGNPRVFGSYEDLFAAAGRSIPDDFYDREQFDPHRPFIDDIAWDCPDCGEKVRRVPEVIDAWFDSGAMPFAQHHYRGQPVEATEPETGRTRVVFDPAPKSGEPVGFPAHLISEAVDQTRGWFYTLHALGVLLFDSPAYRHCIVLGHVNDEQGRKMSKRLGNVVEPMQVMEETGADALRWYFYISNPEQSSRFSARLVREAAQRFLLPLWNAASFFSIYANLDGWRPGAASVAFDQRPQLDRWVLLRLDRLVAEVTGRLEGYRVVDAARALEDFVEQLTNWYIRRSRNRFWAAADDRAAGKESAYQTLYEVLATLTRLLAPFLPFLAETLHERLVRSQRPDAPRSVHLEDWPNPAGRHDDRLEAGMAAIQRIVTLGHAARQSHSLKTRQPLARVVLVSADRELPTLVAEHEHLLCDELNVKALAWAKDPTAYVEHRVRPVFPRLGPRFGRRMPAVKAALEQADGDALARQLQAEGRLSLALDGETHWLERDDVEVELVEHPGLATQADASLLLALETEITPELRDEGWAREVVHRIQTARKAADLDYADRVRLSVAADPALARAIATHRDWISNETLAVELVVREAGGAAEEPIDGLAFALDLARA